MYKECERELENRIRSRTKDSLWKCERGYENSIKKIWQNKRKNVRIRKEYDNNVKHHSPKETRECEREYENSILDRIRSRKMRECDNVKENTRI